MSTVCNAAECPASGRQVFIQKDTAAAADVFQREANRKQTESSRKP